LLGKKSWNVYNPAAIARVRADEAAEEARIEAEDELADERDAVRRLAILRGITPSLSPPRSERSEIPERLPPSDRERERYDCHRSKRRRGEDDTDRDLRLAREQLEPPVREEKASSRHQRREESNVSITDRSGHIQLFQPPKALSKGTERNKEAETERKKKERELEDQYTMRFSNATGYGGNSTRQPWYSGIRAPGSTETESVGLNAFGKPDEGRKDRDQKRLQSSDPMAAMRAGQRRLKQVEKEREEWRREKDEETATLKREERRRRRVCDDDIDGFSLDHGVGSRVAREGHNEKEYRRQRSPHKPRDSKRRSRSPSGMKRSLY